MVGGERPRDGPARNGRCGSPRCPCFPPVHAANTLCPAARRRLTTRTRALNCGVAIAETKILPWARGMGLGSFELRDGAKWGDPRDASALWSSHSLAHLRSGRDGGPTRRIYSLAHRIGPRSVLCCPPCGVPECGACTIAIADAGHWGGPRGSEGVSRFLPCTYGTCRIRKVVARAGAAARALGRARVRVPHGRRQVQAMPASRPFLEACRRWRSRRA